MKRSDCVILGVNHQFLYIESVKDPGYHEKTLKRLANDSRFEALDFWIWAAEPYRSREIDILKSSGKFLNYNIGDRFGEKTVCYSSADPKEHSYALERFKRETEMAIEAGSRKIIMASGPDFPENRPAALEAFAGFIQQAYRLLPEDIMLSIEPTDRDLDKHFLLGPLDETVDFVKKLRASGCENLSILLDMGHIPLLREQIGPAVEKTASCLGHIHMSNCIVKNPSHPLFGDQHVPWCCDEGEYYESDVRLMVKKLCDMGYFKNGLRQTLSFEMRPYNSMTPDESADRFIEIFDAAWDDLNR